MGLVAYRHKYAFTYKEKMKKTDSPTQLAFHINCYLLMNTSFVRKQFLCWTVIQHYFCDSQDQDVALKRHFKKQRKTEVTISFVTP